MPHMTSTTKSFGLSPTKNIDSNKDRAGDETAENQNKTANEHKHEDLNFSRNLNINNLNQNSLETMISLDHDMVQVEPPMSPQKRAHIPTNRELFEKRNNRKVYGTLDYDKVNN